MLTSGSSVVVRFNQQAPATPNIETDDRLPLGAWQKLEAWRVKLDGTPKLKKRDAFERAADDLFLEAETQRNLGVVQRITDAIYQLGCDHAGLSDDDIQFVMAGAKGKVERLSNGHAKDSAEEPPPAMNPHEYGHAKQPNERPESITLRYYSDLKEATPKSWFIKNVIARGEISSLIGPPGSGKSALITDIFTHGAAGINWRGYRTKSTFGGLYFALERVDLVKRRLIAHRLRDNLATDLPIAIAGQVIDLMDRACVQNIVDAIKQAEDRFGREIGLVAFDTYAKGIAAGGGDESLAKDQNVVLANLRRVLDKKTSTLPQWATLERMKARASAGQTPNSPTLICKCRLAAMRSRPPQ